MRVLAAFITLAVFPPALAGQWFHEKLKDEMTDKVSWRISSFAFPFRDPVTVLNWWCDEDGPDLFLSIGEYLTGDEVLVQYRFDTDPASTAQRWRFTAPLVYAPKDLIQAMTARAKTAAKVLIRVTDEAGAYTYTFDLDGSLKAADRARTRSLYADKRGRISRTDSLLLNRYAGDSLTFAAAFDQLACNFERKDTGVAFPFPEYLQNIERQVLRRWQRPGRTSLEAEVSFFVQRDGSVTDLQFIRRSGNFAFDLEAQGAVEEAGRFRAFGALPDGWTADVLFVRFYFSGQSVRAWPDERKAEASDQVFVESVVEERPEILSGPALVYPDLLRQAGVQGRVLIQAIIDTTGRAEPSSVKVIQSPNPGFDQSAKNYVLRALFRPARVHGRAVRVLLNLPIDFKIKR